MTTDQLTRREVDPCDMPCEKCGASDVLRRFRHVNDRIKLEEYGKCRNRFASPSAFSATVYREHIDHHCRCCSFEWQTPPKKKPRKPKTLPHRTSEDV